MKKAFAVVFTSLLAFSLASCNQSDKTVLERSEILITPTESSMQSEAVLEESQKENTSSSISDISKEVLENLEISEISEISEVSEVSMEQSSQASKENEDKNSSTQQLIETVVDVEKLGDKTKTTVTDILEGDEIYMNVTGKIELFGGITSNFDVEFAKSDDGTMEKLTFGGQSVKIIQNSDGTYTIDDENKTATLTGDAYNSDENTNLSDTTDSYTPNSFANQIISYFSSDFGLDSLKYEKSGSEEYEGKTYSFDEYSSDGYIIKIYFDGNKPEYIVSTDEHDKTSVIEINSLTFSPDSEIFKIPEDYKVVSE